MTGTEQKTSIAAVGVVLVGTLIASSVLLTLLVLSAEGSRSFLDNLLLAGVMTGIAAAGGYIACTSEPQ